MKKIIPFFSRSEKRVTIKRPPEQSENLEGPPIASLEQSKLLRKELMDKSSRLEAIMGEKHQLQNREAAIRESMWNNIVNFADKSGL